MMSRNPNSHGKRKGQGPKVYVAVPVAQQHPDPSFPPQRDPMSGQMFNRTSRHMEEGEEEEELQEMESMPQSRWPMAQNYDYDQHRASSQKRSYPNEQKIRSGSLSGNSPRDVAVEQVEGFKSSWAATKQAFESLGRPIKTKLRRPLDENTAASYGDSEYAAQSDQFAENIKALQDERDWALNLKDRAQHELDDANQKIASRDQFIGKLQRQLENKELFLGPQDTDSTICGQFNSLIGTISAFVAGGTGYFKDAVESPASKTSQILVKHYRNVLPNTAYLSEVLNDSKRRRFFVRGWLAYRMTQKFFRTYPDGSHLGSEPEDAWMTTYLAKSVWCIDNSFHEAAKQQCIPVSKMHDWRALTMNLLLKYQEPIAGNQFTSQIVDGEVEEIFKDLGQWIPQVSHAKARRDLRNLLIKAVELSQLLRRQRAYWFVCFEVLPETVTSSGATIMPMVYDQRIMEDKKLDEFDANTNKAPLVEIIYQPGLYKRGNSDGELYDVEECKVKAQVQCKYV